VNCGIDYFIRKYEQRGAFSNLSFERWLRLPFHLRSRDVVGTGDSAAIRAFYTKHVLCRDQAEADSLIQAGLGLRVTVPSTLLAGQEV
jgi:hypothetical protein